MVLMITNIAKVDTVRHHHQQKQVNCRKKMRGWHFEGFALGPAKSLQVKQTDVGLTVTRAEGCTRAWCWLGTVGGEAILITYWHWLDQEG